MSWLVRRIIGVAILGTCGLTGAQGQPTEVPFARPDGPKRVEITLYWGRLEVRAHDRDSVVVESRSTKTAGDATVLRPPAKGFVVSSRDGSSRISTDASVVSVVADSPETSGVRSLDLLVLVPERVDLVVGVDGGGEILVEGVHGGLEVSTNNGSVELRRVGGWASVDALNGSILAEFETVDADRSMSFGTLNGEIDLTLPPDVAMDVRIQVNDDEIRSDFDLSDSQWRPAQSGESPRRLEARIGGGGPLLFLATHNGQIVLRSRSEL